MSSYFSFIMELCFSFCSMCVCVWYVYVDLIKLLVGGNRSFWHELTMGMYLIYLGKSPKPNISNFSP